MNTLNKCCINCNKEIQQAISQSLQDNIFIFSAFIVLALIIGALFYLVHSHYKNTTNGDDSALISLTCAAIVLGIGTGGFADGIVLHQILQWHEMLSSKLPADTLVYKSTNMFWDGIFHLFTLVVTIAGIYLLWKVLKKNRINQSGNILIGGMIGGWGVFNVVEGIINHQILGLHNVRELSPDKELWNFGFLFFGIMLIVMGWFIIRKAKEKGKTNF